MFKKILSLFLSFCVLSSFVSMNMFLPLVCAAESADEEKALIPDDNLRAALRKELRKSKKKYITESDLAAIIVLDLQSKGIKDLTGLEKCEALELLNLSNNQITDISALSGLNNLTYLNLSDNQITDISALSGLNNLTDLDLSHNQITDISDLSGLDRLYNLYLSNNQITDISDLSGLDRLCNLYLYDNQITGISALSRLPVLSNWNAERQHPVLITPILGDCDNLTITVPKIANVFEISHYSKDDEVKESGLICVDGKISIKNVNVDDYITYSFSSDRYDFSGTVKHILPSLSDETLSYYGKPEKAHYIVGNRTYVKLNESGITWLKEESDGSSAWYGLENPMTENGETLFPKNSYFYVEWVSPDDLEKNEHYAILDDSVKSQVDSNRGWLFNVGIADVTGEKLDIDFKGHTANLYVQIGDDWQLEDLKSVFVKDSEDEQVNVTFASDIDYPEGRDDFGILSLNHFSPYFVYDAKNMNGDLNNNNRNNFWSMIKDFFITGDLKTKIIAWSSVGLILTAFGVLVFMKKYKKIK